MVDQWFTGCCISGIHHFRDIYPDRESALLMHGKLSLHSVKGDLSTRLAICKDTTKACAVS
jgi:hypothetical protein